MAAKVLLRPWTHSVAKDATLYTFSVPKPEFFANFDGASTPVRRCVSDLWGQADWGIVAFNPKTGQLPNNWLPQVVELAPWEEMRLPKSPVVWNWATGAKPFECSIASQELWNTLAGHGRLIYVKKLLPESYTPSRLGRVARLFHLEEEKEEPESIA